MQRSNQSSDDIFSDLHLSYISKAKQLSAYPIMPVLAVPLNRAAGEQIALNQVESHSPAGLPVENPTPSFWTSSSPDANPLASEGSEGPLTQDADICIIGSGITGVPSLPTSGLHVSLLIFYARY